MKYLFLSIIVSLCFSKTIFADSSVRAASSLSCTVVLAHELAPKAMDVPVDATPLIFSVGPNEEKTIRVAVKNIIVGGQVEDGFYTLALADNKTKESFIIPFSKKQNDRTLPNGQYWVTYGRSDGPAGRLAGMEDFGAFIDHIPLESMPPGFKTEGVATLTCLKQNAWRPKLNHIIGGEEEQITAASNKADIALCRTNAPNFSISERTGLLNEAINSLERILPGLPDGNKARVKRQLEELQFYKSKSETDFFWDASTGCPMAAFPGHGAVLNH